jgi:hypothetical protein
MICQLLARLSNLALSPPLDLRVIGQAALVFVLFDQLQRLADVLGQVSASLILLGGGIQRLKLGRRRFPQAQIVKADAYMFKG